MSWCTFFFLHRDNKFKRASVTIVLFLLLGRKQVITLRYVMDPDLASLLEFTGKEGVFAVQGLTQGSTVGCPARALSCQFRIHMNQYKHKIKGIDV